MSSHLRLTPNATWKYRVVLCNAAGHYVWDDFDAPGLVTMITMRLWSDLEAGIREHVRSGGGRVAFPVEERAASSEDT